MYLWPYKKCRIETGRTADEVYEIVGRYTDQDYDSIYWGKRFYSRFFGSVGKTAFRVRPVVPYWNISPLEIRATVKEGKNGKTRIACRLSCPYLRVVVPLVLLGVILFFLNYVLAGTNGGAVNVMILIVAGAYAMVNIPFQIQASRSLRELTRQLEGRFIMER